MRGAHSVWSEDIFCKPFTTFSTGNILHPKKEHPRLTPRRMNVVNHRIRRDAFH
jgi:hypothetical protein